MEKFKVIRDDGQHDYPAINFIGTALRKPQFPWFYSPFTVAETETFFHHRLSDIYEVKDNWLYMHYLVPPNGGQPPEHSIDFQILKALRSLEVIPEFDTHRLTRAQVNCVHRTERTQISPPHRDFDGPGCVYIYYANESDGDTILFDEEGNIEAKVTPAAGHFVRMDSRQWHSSTTPTSTSRRFVINLNFQPK